MAFWTYLLLCADRSYYTGHTDDLDRRVAQHQSGAIRGYTFTRRPVELMWADYFQTREEALTAELKIKGWSRAKKEALIARDWDRLKRFSRPPKERFKSSAPPKQPAEGATIGGPLRKKREPLAQSLAGARHSPSTSLGRSGSWGWIEGRLAAVRLTGKAWGAICTRDACRFHPRARPTW